MANPPDLSDLIEQLQHKSSPKRRAAAKKIRKLKTEGASAGAPLQCALENEITDDRTWETQYQMIMALGEIEHVDSLSYLHELAKQSFKATMVYVALGDSVTRLTLVANDGDANSIVDLLEDNHPMFVNGVLRATAMLQLTPDDSTVRRIVNYGKGLEAEDDSRTWIAAAAAGWDDAGIAEFLEQCVASNNQQTQRAAKAALENKYLKWSPL